MKTIIILRNRKFCDTVKYRNPGPVSTVRTRPTPTAYSRRPRTVVSRDGKQTAIILEIQKNNSSENSEFQIWEIWQIGTSGTQRSSTHCGFARVAGTECPQVVKKTTFRNRKIMIIIILRIILFNRMNDGDTPQLEQPDLRCRTVFALRQNCSESDLRN